MFRKLDYYLEKILFHKTTIFLFLIIFFKPLLFYYYPPINTAFNLAMAFFAVFILLSYIINIYQTKKISKIQIALLIYISILSLSTMFGSQDFGTLIRIYGRWIIMSFYVELLVLKQRDQFFKILNIFLAVLITMQALSTIIFPYGIIDADPSAKLYVYFLGNDNTTVLTMVLGTLFNVYYSHYRYRRLTFLPIFTTILVNISFLVTRPATGLIAIAILDMFLCIFYKRNKHPRIFNLRNYFILALVLFLAIVIFHCQDLFSFIIEDILHKELTLSGRIFIWDSCLFHIQNHPLLGLGVQEYATRFSIIGIYHAHCTLLNVLLESGILGLLAYLNIFRVIWNQIKKSISTEYANILSFGFLIYFITGLAEVYHDSQMLQIFLILAYYTKTIYKAREKQTRNLIKNNTIPKVLVVTSGGLPIPAIKGGAVETLLESYLKVNEKNYQYNFEVYSSYAKNVEQYSNTYHNTKFYYMHNEKLEFQIERYVRAFCRRILRIPINPPFIQKVIDEIIMQDKDNYYDAIIIENNPTLIPALAKAIHGKILLHLHNDDLNINTRNSKKIYDDCHHIYTVSNYIKNRVETIDGPGKTTVLMNGINQEALRRPVKADTRQIMRAKYGLAESNVVFMFGGRICPDKGVYELLQAFIKAQEKLPNIKLLIVGSSFFDGAKATPYVKKLQALAQNYQDKIIFTGYIDHANMGTIYTTADVQIIPSMFDDPCPLAVLEGMTMGLPQIATLSGGIPEEVTAKNAVLVDRKDIVDQLADAMIKLANDPELRKTMSQASLERSEDFTEEAYIQEFYHLLNQEVQKGGKV